MRKLPNVFNREEIKRLVENIDQTWLMVAVLLGLFCGLRRNEVSTLRMTDIDLVSHRIKIWNSKNPNRTIEGYGKDRIVPIPDCLIRVLQQWIDFLGHGALRLFPSIKNPSEPISNEHLFRAYKQALRRANLDPVVRVDTKGLPRHKYNFHTLRHTYATLLWEKTGDILTVKHALGHAKLDTTLIYTHVANKVVEEKINSAFGFKTVNNTIQTEHLDPSSILLRRLAIGEINQKQFRALREELRRQKQEQHYIG